MHVAEMEIGGAMFHLHEEKKKSKHLSPEILNGTSVLLGIFVSDPHQLVKQAEGAGGKIFMDK